VRGTGTRGATSGARPHAHAPDRRFSLDLPRRIIEHGPEWQVNRESFPYAADQLGCTERVPAELEEIRSRANAPEPEIRSRIPATICSVGLPEHWHGRTFLQANAQIRKGIAVDLPVRREGKGVKLDKERGTIYSGKEFLRYSRDLPAEVSPPKRAST